MLFVLIALSLEVRSHEIVTACVSLLVFSQVLFRQQYCWMEISFFLDLVLQLTVWSSGSHNFYVPSSLTTCTLSAEVTS